MLAQEQTVSWGRMMKFVQADVSAHHFDCTIFKKGQGASACLYSGSALFDNGAHAPVAHGTPAHAAKRTGQLRHTSPMERCPLGSAASGRVYPRPESVHRFEQVLGFGREGWCRRTTKKRTSGKGCGRAANYCKPSLSCVQQSRVTGQLTRNTCAIFAPTGGVDIEYYKSPGINSIRFTWVLALAGWFGCSARSLATTAPWFSTTPDVRPYSVSPACGPSTPGNHRKRKAGRLGLRLTSRHGSGRCATLHPRQGTRKNSRPASTRRAVA